MQILNILVLHKWDIDWELKTFNIMKNSAPQILGMFDRIEYDNASKTIVLYEKNGKNVFTSDNWFEELNSNDKN